MRAVLELKVWHKDDQSCFFLLLWDNRKKQLTASVSGAGEVQRRYQRWQQRYARFYLPASRSISDSGRLNPGSGDPGNDLREAETELIHAFHRWLGEGETRKIQQRIRDELMRIAQQTTAQGKEMEVPTGIDLFLACDTAEMARLPWEAWELTPADAPPRMVRLIRTGMDLDGADQGLNLSPTRKARILALLGEDPNLPLQEHWKALRSLRSIAEVERITWLPDEDPVAIKTRIAQAICDDRGWDVLFFAGHSDETTVMGGRFAIAPHISCSISDLEEQLAQAKERGLQLAIFNSCSGLSIAHALMDLGVQVVAMREPIRNDVAQTFLKYLCQELKQHKDILDALVNACQYLQSIEKFAFPSAHLLPSFFSPPNVAPYRIEPFGWQRQLRQWVPAKVEAIAFGTVLALSLLTPVRDFLYQQRMMVQAIYRDWTHQLSPTKTPPVLLIEIDQESFNRAISKINQFRIEPIDRRYLANIIHQLNAFDAKTVGITYRLDTQESGEEALVDATQTAVKMDQTWFVFAMAESDNWIPRNSIANPGWTLRGDGNIYDWELPLPDDPTCVQVCPFPYVLALSHILNQQVPFTLPQPTVQNRGDFQVQVSQYINQTKVQNKIPISLPSLPQTKPPLGLQVMLDFSIPPDQVFERLSAWKFLNSSPTSESPKRFQQQVVIISGGHFDAVDNFPVLPAVDYWCRFGQNIRQQLPDCPNSVTIGEVYAYTVHHLLLHHRIIRFPDWWMVCLAAILGKDVTLMLLKSPHHQRRKLVYGLAGATIVAGLIDLQLYTSASVSIPWLLPSLMFWAYIIAHQKSTRTGNFRSQRNLS
ncbi:MAG: CHASE2 domain-containing protein [Leptolyngbyaceae cyanobacterium HOT.MB2.61]|nr:CHASE2 domain-containing protein [Leptolyngbyaceae cyanobacterium HOT.MB2.61]